VMSVLSLVPRQPVVGKLSDERDEVLTRFLRYLLSVDVQALEQVMDGVLPVKKFPHKDAGRVQTKAMAGIGVEEDRPVVELLAEYDERIPHGSAILIHGSASRSRTVIARTEAHLSRDMDRLSAT